MKNKYYIKYKVGLIVDKLKKSFDHILKKQQLKKYVYNCNHKLLIT